MASKVSIIGAGLAGLALALQLEQQSIPVEIFELRQSKEGHILGGAVMLSPNGLRVMDKLGVYDRIKDKGFQFERVDFRDDQYNLKAHYYMGQKTHYGYPALRVYRQTIVDAMKALLKERNIPVHYGLGFSKVVDESDDRVIFETTDGVQHQASMLIGADGIHSSVRKHITPVQPKYTGLTAITSAIAATSLAIPSNVDNFQLPVTIMGGRGAFVVAPQDPAGTELLVGTQFAFPELDQAGWRALTGDRARVVSMLNEGKAQWPEFVQSALGGVTGEKINVWPFYLLPKLERWTSGTGRVVLVGDSAHALPPSAGQGINQAMEDACTLGLLLGRIGSTGVTASGALGLWQEMRQKRIDWVLGLNALMDRMRLPEAKRREALEGSRVGDWASVAGGEGQLAWLYDPGLEGMVDEWVASIAK